MIVVPFPRLVLLTPGPLFSRSETAVDEGFLQIESATAAEVFGQRLQHTAHDTKANPMLETPMAGLVKKDTARAGQPTIWPVRRMNRMPLRTSRLPRQGRSASWRFRNQGVRS